MRLWSEPEDWTKTGRIHVSGSLAAVAVSVALLHPSPPIHRERCRLWKKSRPLNFEEGIFELDDHAELAEQVWLVTPKNTKKTRDVPATSLDDPLMNVGNTSTTKTPLLSRISSIGKKWSGRKKRVSTGPPEVALQERDEEPRERQRHQDGDRLRPTSFTASSSPGHGGTQGPRVSAESRRSGLEAREERRVAPAPHGSRARA